jgi:hypothetical protein
MEHKDLKNIFDESIRKKALSGKNAHKYRSVVTLLIIIVLVGLTNFAAYALSGEYRELLATVLHLKSEDIHYLGYQDSNNGIRMTVVSSHVVNGTAVILYSFEKENGKRFENGMNPSMNALKINSKEISESAFSCGYTELSEDSKILYCYFEWTIPENISNQSAELCVQNLICNQSQVLGSTWQDQLIEGKWKVTFSLQEDPDNTLTIINDNHTDEILLCGKELQIDNIVISDMIIKVSTTTLKETKVPFDPLSNIYTGSGAYYGIYIHLKYKDGTMTDQIDCFLDNENNIMACLPETIQKANISEVHIGDIIIKVSDHIP